MKSLLSSHLDSHDSLLVVLSKMADEIQQLITLLLGSSHPTPLEIRGEYTCAYVWGGGGVYLDVYINISFDPSTHKLIAHPPPHHKNRRKHTPPPVLQTIAHPSRADSKGFGALGIPAMSQHSTILHVHTVQVSRKTLRTYNIKKLQ